MRDRRRIADLYLQGRLQTDIAAEVGLSQSTVNRELAALHEEWQQASLADMDKVKSEQLAKIDRLEREYWDAWVMSQGEQTATSKKLVREGEKEKAEASTRVEVQPGDPRFLEGVQWCITQRCKILGINAPTKVDLPPGTQVTITNIEAVRPNGGTREDN